MQLKLQDSFLERNGGLTGSASLSEEIANQTRNSPPQANRNTSPILSAPAQPSQDPIHTLGNHAFKARALYPYTASPDEPSDISFAKGEVFDIVDDSSDWWQARKEDGATGTVPSNFFLPLEGPRAGASHMYKARALYAYTGDPDKPEDISFTRGEILEIVDDSDDWWQARKADGTIGTVPSNFLQPLGKDGAALGAEKDPKTKSNGVHKARALYAYTTSPDESTDISFAKGEILDILDNSGDWWQARKEDGTIGTVPSNFFQFV